MHAMVHHQTSPIEANPLELRDVPDPSPQAHEIRVQVKTCAICRTDLHIIEGDLPTAKLPVIPGHQIVGVVDHLGRDASKFRVGQRIGIAWLAHTDSTCRYCTGGRENLCPNSRYTGYHLDGGYAQFAVAHEDFVYEIPARFDDVTAAPLLCAGIIGYRALKRAYVPSKGSLAIFGFGSSAHIVIQIALHRGYRVFVVSRSESHQKLARQLGAAWAGSDVLQMPQKVDSAIVFAPVGSVVPAALECLAPGGTVSLAGIHMTPIPELDYQKHLFGERDVHPVTANTRDDARELLREAALANVKPHMVAYELADANRALQDMKAGRIDGTGVLVIR
jgi:alcohol dehydrogenase, propanol-preferring